MRARHHLAAQLFCVSQALSCAHEPQKSPSVAATTSASHSFSELEQQVEPAPREPASILAAREVDADLDLLVYALERGYGGRPFVPPDRWEAMSRRLGALRGHAATVDELCNGIADALWLLPDAHLSAARQAPADRASIKCGSLSKQERRIANVGPNYASDGMAAPWAADVVSVGAATFGLISIRHFPPGEDPAWASFERTARDLMQSDGLVIDLRGSGGGDDSRGYQLARLLIDGPIASGVVRAHERNTPEALTLLMNTYREIGRQPDGGLAAHLVARHDEVKNARDQAARSTQPEWRVKDAPKTSVVPGPNAYQGPIAILVDAGCASSCESTFEALRGHQKAKVFGERTAGDVHFGDVGSVSLPNSAVRVGIPTKYNEYPAGKLHDKIGFDPDVTVQAGANAFDVSMAWMLSQTAKARIVKPTDFVVPETSRNAETARLTQLGLSVPAGGPVLERPWALPLSRRSFVVPQRWLFRKPARVVHAPALLADLDALELVMSRAYGGWAIAEKHGWSWRSWFDRWRAVLGAGPAWIPLQNAFSPVDELQRFQLDNHTSLPLGSRPGTGSRTVLLDEQPSGPCASLRDKSGREIPINPSDPAQATKVARRFDGERLTPAWYLAFPANRGEIDSARCGTKWLRATAPKMPERKALTAGILELSSQPNDRPFLRHLTPDVAYLRLPTFSKVNTEIIERDRSSWEARAGKERVLIIDLRGNEGGDAAFQALDGWVSADDIRSSLPFNKRAGSSCLYPALRWGYTGISSGGLKPPLSDPMRASLQSTLAALFENDDPQCPAKYDLRSAAKHYHGRLPPHPRKGKPLLMVLVDQECGSDCELMTATLAKLPEAVVVGVNTFGVAQYIQPGYSVLPNTRLPYRVALGTSDVYGDDRSVDGFGLDVDVVIDGETAWSKDGLLRLARMLANP